MENPRPEKVAVVDEVRERLGSTDAALLTEYRGLSVAAIGELRRALRAAGGDYKIYKNTLVRFAVRDLGLAIDDELLTGPTAIAFVGEKPDGSKAEAVEVAKALKDFARVNPALVVKGGVLGAKSLTAAEAQALADIEPREVLLARLAGAIAAPLTQFAGLLQAMPRDLAYGLKALVDQSGGVADDAAQVEPSEAADSADSADSTDSVESTDSPDETDTSQDDAPAAAADQGTEENEE
ncbi:MAG: 50S ribosomal protein L10 [Acidimicrobiia bacterium]